MTADLDSLDYFKDALLAIDPTATSTTIGARRSVVLWHLPRSIRGAVVSAPVVIVRYPGRHGDHHG
jgi:hypothetical protein